MGSRHHDRIEAARHVEARRLRNLAEADGRQGPPRMAPVGERTIVHDAARLFARRRSLAADDPGRYVLSAAPNKRNGRIFRDYLRNGRGMTAVGTYSPRAREGFPIAAPVT